MANLLPARLGFAGLNPIYKFMAMPHGITLARGVGMLPRSHSFNSTVAVLGAGISGLTAAHALMRAGHDVVVLDRRQAADRKSTRLNSSHSQISYAVFCLKKI